MRKKSSSRLADPFFVQGHEVFMTASLGIGLLPERRSQRNRPYSELGCGSVPLQEVGGQRIFVLLTENERSLVLSA